MKKISAILLAFMLCIIAAFPAFAADDYEAPSEAESQTEERQNTSHPRFMVTAYDTGGNITPNGKSTLKITIKNQSKDKKIENIQALPRFRGQRRNHNQRHRHSICAIS